MAGGIQNIDSEQFEAGYVAWRTKKLWKAYQAIKYRFVFPILGVDRGRHILDVGCAKGHFVSMLLEHGFSQVDGMDIADRLFPGVRGRMGFYIDSIASPRLDLPKRYDILLFQNVLHHLTAQEVCRAIANMKNLLNEGGQVWIYDVNSTSILGALFYRGLLRIYPEHYRLNTLERADHDGFCRRWPAIVSALECDFRVIRHSNWNFYKVLVVQKRSVPADT
jgi:2-polyprenyl-3-methyl-5-hydroxy-6-metoxy-1,4-benzoquinol methylase